MRRRCGELLLPRSPCVLLLLHCAPPAAQSPVAREDSPHSWLSPGSRCAPRSAWRSDTAVFTVSSFLAGELRGCNLLRAPVKSRMVGLFSLLLCPALPPPLASWPSSDCRLAGERGRVLVLSPGKERLVLAGTSWCHGNARGE